MDLHVVPLTYPAIGLLPMEIVERKGLGHPDTLCDGLAENLSVALSRFYLERFGAILHHNVDKGLLVGGAARPSFGGGSVLEPIEIYLCGRATAEFGGVKVPVDELAVEASRAWLRARIRHLDPVRHVRIRPRIRPTSPGLAALFLRQAEAGTPLANDTSCGVGFAPLDALERTVLAVEHHLNARATKEAHPQIGEDIKVMGVRRGETIALTVACALVDRHVADLADYRAKKSQVAALAADAAQAVTGHPVEVLVNAADGESADSVYLTVTGLSAESGDDGQVGRGNRANGLLTPYRPMSLEAVCGKNPVSHVGKLYNVVASRAAAAIVADVAEVEEAYCFLASHIGCSILEPRVFDIKVRLEDARALDALRPRITEVALAQLERLNVMWRDAIEGALDLG